MNRIYLLVLLIRKFSGFKIGLALPVSDLVMLIEKTISAILESDNCILFIFLYHYAKMIHDSANIKYQKIIADKIDILFEKVKVRHMNKFPDFVKIQYTNLRNIFFNQDK